MKQVLDQAAVQTFVLTNDSAAARPFYEDTLGLRVVAEDPFAVTFAMAGEATLRLTPMPGHQPSAHTVVGWAVSDIVASVRALTEKGVAFQVYDGFGQDADGIWSAPDGSAKVAWFCDHDGNVLSLSEFA